MDSDPSLGDGVEHLPLPDPFSTLLKPPNFNAITLFVADPHHPPATLLSAQYRRFLLIIRVGTTMASRDVLLCALVVMRLAMVGQAADPELTTDFFVPADMNKANLTGDYFTSSVFRELPDVGTGKYAIIRLTSDSFPVLTGLGVSHAVVRFLPGGINPPHTHPRGTETLVVLDGELTVGLVGSDNKLYTQVLEIGDLFVFPRGLVHYQINLGDKPVLAYDSFSSSNAGTVSLPTTLFGSGIHDGVLTAAFKVENDVIDKLQAAQGQK